MPEPKHIHTYERSRANPKVYRCIDPDCTHYHSAEFLVGKRALCNKCQEAFVLERAQLVGKNSVKRPLCLNCSNSARAKAHREMLGVAEALLAEINKETL